MLAPGPATVAVGGDTLFLHQWSAFGGHDTRPLKHRLRALEKFRAFVLWLAFIDPAVRFRASNRRSQLNHSERR